MCFNNLSGRFNIILSSVAIETIDNSHKEITSLRQKKHKKNSIRHQLEVAETIQQTKLNILKCNKMIVTMEFLYKMKRQQNIDL